MVNGGSGIRKLYIRVRLKQAAVQLRNARQVALFHAKLAPQYIKFAADYSTDPQTRSIIPSLIIFYLLCIWNGWYNTFVVTLPTQTLEVPLSHIQYEVFVRITLVAPIFTLLGMCLRGKWAWTGAVMQLAGDLGVAGVLWTFIAAIFYTSWWGQGNFAGTWVLASAIGAIVFIIRDIRRLADRDRWEIHHA